MILKMRFPNNVIICIVFLTAVSTKIRKNQFSASVFIFYDEGNRLHLNNEITTLKFWCSGGIIAPAWILTTATCFQARGRPIRPESYIVVPTKGATLFENSTHVKPYEVESIILDKNWKFAVNDVNLAVLLLKNAIHFNNKIGKTRVAPHTVKTTSHCESLMWMRQPSKKSKDVIFKPQILNGHIDRKCKDKKYRNEFCFIFKMEDEFCYDVQGSILMCNKNLQGIASSKYGGAAPLCTSRRNRTYLNVHYVDTGNFNRWINHHMENEVFRYNQSRNTKNESSNQTFSDLLEILLIIMLCYLLIHLA